MNVNSITRYDPNQKRDYATLKIGRFTVVRRPLLGTPHTVYSVMGKYGILGRVISFPSLQDCEYIERQASYSRERKESLSVAVVDEAIDAAGGAKSVTARIVLALTDEKMGLAKLGTALKVHPDLLSPILTRLVNRGTILRRGARGKYVYEIGQA